MRLPYSINRPTPSKVRKGRERGLARPSSGAADGPPKRWQIGALLEALREAARRFPGHRDPTSAAQAQRRRNGNSTPDQVPSLDLFRRGVLALPNGPGFTDYNGHYVRGLFALVGAVLGTEFEAEGLELIAEWQARYGGDPYHDQEKIERARRETHTGWRHVIEMIRQFDPAAADELRRDTWRAWSAANPISEEELAMAISPNPTRDRASAAFAVDAAIAELNERYAYVLSLGAIVEFPVADDEKVSYRVISRQGFQDYHADRFVISGPNGRPTTRGLGSIWLQSPKKRKFRRVGLWEVGQEPKDALNLYTGLPDRSTLPEAADAKGPRVTGCPLWYAFLFDIVADGRLDVYEDLLDRNALKIQHPLGKSTVSLVLIGDTRIGKSFYAEHVRDIFGKKFTRKFAEEHRFLGNFNAQLEGLLVAELEEAIFGRDPRLWGTYKDKITSTEMQVEHKGVNTYDAQNCMDFIVCSNFRTSVRVELRDERHTVLRLNPKHQNDRVYFGALREEWVNGGREAFIQDMLARDLKGMRFLTALRTREKAEVSEATADPVTQFWSNTLEQGRGHLRSYSSNPPDWNRGKIFMTRVDLLEAYSDHCRQTGARVTLTATGLAREINDICREAKERRMTVGGDQVWGLEFPALDACRKSFEKMLGSG